MVRLPGLEPGLEAWEASVLTKLDYSRQPPHLDDLIKDYRCSLASNRRFPVSNVNAYLELGTPRIPERDV